MTRARQYTNYDSGFEKLFADHLEKLGIPFERERDAFIYIETVRKSVCRECGSENCGQRRIYRPDFFLPAGVIIETKGYLDAPARSRHKLIREQHPGLDLRLVFQRDHVIKQTKNKDRYSDWCRKNDIKFWICREMPPKEWLLKTQWE